MGTGVPNGAPRGGAEARPQLQSMLEVTASSRGRAAAERRLQSGPQVAPVRSPHAGRTRNQKVRVSDMLNGRGSKSRGPWLVGLMVAAFLALGSTGCYESGTNPPASDDGAGSADVPSMSELQSKVGLTSEQATELGRSHARWRSDEPAWHEDEGDDAPALDFLAAAASILDHGQMTRLASVLHENEVEHLGEEILSDGFGLDGLGGPGPRGDHRDGRGMGPGREGRVGDLFQGLDLTPQQRVQLRAARAAFVTAVHALVLQLRNGSIDEQQFEDGVHTARTQYETSVQNILTPEQWAQLQAALRARLIAALQRQLANFDTKVTRRVACLDVILGLSDQQVTDITAALMAAKPPLETVLAGLQDGSLSLADARTALENDARDTIAAVRALLTDGQRAIFDLLRLFHHRAHRCR